MEQPPHTLTRRAFFGRARRAGLAAAAGVPLASWLAGCGSAPARIAMPAAKRTATPQPTATPDAHPITIAITGDIMLGRTVNRHMLVTGDGFPFTTTAAYLRGFDLTVGNLECVVSTLGSPQPKEYTFEADPLGFERLAAAGFDIVSVATNHSGDYGKDAFVDMLQHLPQHGITPLGGGENLVQAHQPVVKTLHGTTVGFLAYCEIEPQSFAATATTPGHAWLTAAALRADIAATRPGVDYLIVFTHWGIEYHPLANDHQRFLAQTAIDAGADFVVGAHPHVIQPSETYKGKPIVYSLGNFVFDMMYSADVRTGHVLALTLHGSRLVDWTLRTSYIGDYGEPSWV